MTKDEFLKRCANAYDMGLTKDLWLMREWCDAIMRYEAGISEARDHQMHYFRDFIEREKERTHNFRNDSVLANDEAGYKIIVLTSLLAHPCQKCAEDPTAWHTRYAFCEHKGGAE